MMFFLLLLLLLMVSFCVVVVVVVSYPKRTRISRTFEVNWFLAFCAG